MVRHIRLVVEDAAHDKWRALLDKHNLTWESLLALGAKHLEQCPIMERALADLGPKKRGPRTNQAGKSS